jgi:hypothetical protein
MVFVELGHRAFREPPFHFFPISEVWLTVLASRSALILSSNTLAGSSLGSCGTSSPRKALARMAWLR